MLHFSSLSFAYRSRLYVLSANTYMFCVYIFCQAYSSIAKCIAALSVTCPQYGSTVVTQFIADIKVATVLVIDFLARDHIM